MYGLCIYVCRFYVCMYETLARVDFLHRIRVYYMCTYMWYCKWSLWCNMTRYYAWIKKVMVPCVVRNGPNTYFCMCECLLVCLYRCFLYFYVLSVCVLVGLYMYTYLILYIYIRKYIYKHVYIQNIRIQDVRVYTHTYMQICRYT